MKNRETVQKIGQHLKKTFYLAGLAGIVMCNTGCVSSGYVTTQPTYREYSRPPQPSNRHVWVSDGWGWNRPNHVYVQKNGYWKKPAQGRTYVSGTWKESPKGNSWKKGHWKGKNR